MATLKIGDLVNVPGGMYGTLKFLGSVDGKAGRFAGVQLAPEFAQRGKNNGDVAGRSYFAVTVPNSGIFLPVEKAEKRKSVPASPAPPAALGGFNQGGRISNVAASGLQKPNFSQSVGPGASVPRRSLSPTKDILAPRRESLPRPTSPLRKTSNAPTTTPVASKLATPKTRPSLGLNKSAIGAPSTLGGGLKSPTRPSNGIPANKFSQSLRQPAKTTATPGRVRAPGVKSDASSSRASPLGPEPAFDEDELPSVPATDNGADSTPTPAARQSLIKPAAHGNDTGEIKRLQEELEQRDEQLGIQAASIAEMERSLFDLQQMISGGGVQSPVPTADEEELPKDVQTLRAALREKNEKIKALIAEFDGNRADFRSTIDTLEMASTETERVYEKRVEELLDELRRHEERNEDVEGVAQQFKQLEELVAELEEGLEDARRGEAEARGEVEFLRGEVERGRSELRREKERNRAEDQLNGISPSDTGASTGELESLQLKLEQKEDEIRGLKAIVQNMNASAVSRSPNRLPKVNGGLHGHSKTKSTNTVVSLGDDSGERLQQQIDDLESLLDSKTFTQDELRDEVNKLRKSVQFNGKMPIPVPNLSQHSRENSATPKHGSFGASSNSTARPGSMRSARSSNSAHQQRRADFVDATQSPVQEEFEDAVFDHHGPLAGSDYRLAADHASETGQTEASSMTMWCEICEESGHDILTCTNMGFDESAKTPKAVAPTFEPRTSSLTGKDAVREGLRRSRGTSQPPQDAPPPPPVSAPMPMAPAAAESFSDRPAPLSTGPRFNGHNGVSTSTPTNLNSHTKSQLVEGTGDQTGMLGGKESGVINPEKWCALCERDGHDSVDCPLEDAF